MGVFSGHPFQQEGRFASTGRGVFAFSSVMVLIFSILMITKGLKGLQSTADMVDATNEDVIAITKEFRSISNNLQLVSREATPVRDELVSFLQQDVCPLKPGSSTEQEIRSMASSTLTALEDLSNFIQNELEDLNAALDQSEDVTEDVGDAVDKTEFTGSTASLVMIPYFLVPALLLVALLFGWQEVYAERYYCVITWFLMPLFVLMVMFMYFVCGFAVLSAEGNADFCSGGPSNTPEGTLEAILGQYDVQSGSLYYDTITFYSNQCRTESPWDFLEDYYSDLVRTLSSTRDDDSILRLTCRASFCSNRLLPNLLWTSFRPQ